jgi:hypothetical protein
MLNANLIMESRGNTVYRGTLLIFILIFYQQVLVLNIGGSFKSYELIASVFLILWLSRPKIYSNYCVVLFLFFVVSPIPGNLIFLINEEKFFYYNRFPEANDITRFNMSIAPMLVYFYYLICFAAVNIIVGSRKVYEQHAVIVKWFVISGTIVSIYSLYGLVFVNLLGFPDLVPSLIDYRNSRPEFQSRVTGFSAEPGTYVFCLSWILVYLFFYEGLFSKRMLLILISINILVLFLTLSSLILVFILSIFVYTLFFERLKFRLYMVAALSIGGCILYLVFSELIGSDLVEYYFFGKITEFFSSPNNTLSSGSFRAYTSLLGLELFKEFPIFGVGGGNSYFLMWKNEYNIGIGAFGQVIDYSTAPQNSHSKILAELGLFGYSLFLYFFFILMRSIVKGVKASKVKGVKDSQSFIYKVAFIGVLMTFLMLFSVYPEYSLFVWINIALILNHIFWSKKGLVRRLE